MSPNVTAPPSDVYESWNESTAPVDVSVVVLAKVAEFSTPNLVSVPSVAAPTAVGTVAAGALHDVHQDDAAESQDHHRRNDRVAVLVGADHLAERARQAERDHQQQEDLDPVRPRRRIFKRMRGVGVVEAAAVRTEFLDGLLACDRATGDMLHRTTEGVHIGGVEVLDHSAGDEDDRGHRGDRQQNPDGDPDQVHPEVPQTGAGLAGEPAHDRDRDRDTDGGRDEILHRQTGHLGDVGHRRLAGVRLPVRVRHKADRGVPGQRRTGAGELRPGMTDRPQMCLQTLQGVEEEYTDDRDGQHRPGVDAPRLLTVGVDADRAVDPALDPAVPGAGDHAVHVVAEWLVRRYQRSDQGDDEENSGCRRAHQKRSGNMRAMTRKIVRPAARISPTRLAALIASRHP